MVTTTTTTWPRPTARPAPAHDTPWVSSRQLARLAGALYLILAACGGFSELFVRSSIKVSGDAAATADNIRASAALFRLGFVTDVVNITCFVLLALALYVLLAPVNNRIAAAFVIFNLIAVAIMGANLLNHAGALAVATDPMYATALGASSADALALLFLNLHGQGYLIAQIFFGLWLLPLGYLVYRSGYFPRVLGIMLMIGCFGYLAHVVVILISPDFESGLAPFLALAGGLAEILFLLWLLVKGANVARS
jgi:hypothetical protein